MNDEYLPTVGAADPSDEARRSGAVSRPMKLDHESDAESAANDAGLARPGTAAFARRPVQTDTAGGMIRAAREAQGIDLASLAAMLKIPLRKLEALEEGRHTDLPGHTFERALAQAACRVLKLDSKPVLGLLPQLGVNTLEQMGGGINTPLRERGSHGFAGDAPLLLRPGVLVPALIVVAAIVLFLLPADLLPRWSKIGFASGESASAPVASASTGTSTTNVSLPSTSGASPSSAAAASPNTQTNMPATTTSATAITSAASGPIASATGPAAVDEVLAHPETPPSIPVQVTGAEDSWIEVVDAQGHVLLSRTVIAGESVGLDGPLPMKVKIGNARGTRLSLRGENVDLEPWTRDNVARLDLK